LDILTVDPLKMDAPETLMLLVVTVVAIKVVPTKTLPVVLMVPVSMVDADTLAASTFPKARTLPLKS
jgi:hypothetical protein